jgi:hypothetical protein
MASHNHTPEEERRIREAALDETIGESFPSSDPPSSLPNPDEHDTPGFREAREKIADFQRGLAKLNEPMSFEDLFPPAFMRRHTDFEDMDAMVAASGRDVRTAEDFEAIPPDEWESLVRERTRFSSWEAMRGKAAEAYAERLLENGRG